tara:strand:+ start:1907 stop:2668 length:762 start_codon:yes stop_codon:yes gene_type:complete
MDNHLFISHCNLDGFVGFRKKHLKSGLYIGNPSWMEYRLGVLEKYTLASLQNQTDQNFHLLLFCNTQTPEPYKEKLLTLEKEYKFLTLIWDQTHFQGHGGNTVSSMYSSIKKTYLKVRRNTSDEIICTRIGTDDMVEVRYNEIIKGLVIENPVLSIAKGIYWDIETDKFLDSTFPNGPFISVKSTLTDFKGDLREISHSQILEKTKGTAIMNDIPLWIQTCSGTNVWNSLEKMPGRPVEIDREYLKQYFGYEK